MKKVVRILLAILMVMCLTLGITACKSECEKGNHVWETEGTVTTPATCTAKGVRTFKCTLCDETKTEAIDMVAHTPVDASVAATCTTAGTTGATKCSVCGTSIAAGTTIPAKGHTITTWTVCDSDDTKHEGTCTVEGCGVKVTEGHKPNEAGTECTLCHATLGGELPHDHNFDETIADNVTIVTEPDCTTKGSKTVKCSGCDEVTTVEIPALNHDYTDVAWAPSTMVEGKHFRTCTREGCGYIDRKDHTPVVVKGTPATCTLSGTKDGSKCSACDAVITVGETINPLGHTWQTKWESNTTQHWHKCVRCDATTTKADHNFGENDHDLVCTVCDTNRPGENYVLTYEIDGQEVQQSYRRLADAIEFIADNQDVNNVIINVNDDDKVLEGLGVVIPGGLTITINLHGSTYIIASDPVGSTGTATCGFQILAGSNITIIDGTITSDKGSGVKMLVQNYANLTLEGVTLDGRNLDAVSNAPNYTLSNNCGEVLIRKSSVIIAREENGVALDVWYNMGGNYSDGVYVTVGNTCTITGTIEYGSAQAGADLKNKAVLTLPAGTYNQLRYTSNVTACTDTGITINDQPLTANWGEWATVEGHEPTCEKEGLAERFCKLCGLRDTKPLAKTSHTMDTATYVGGHQHEGTCTVCNQTVEVACTEVNYACTVCGRQLYNTRPVPVSVDISQKGYANAAEVKTINISDKITVSLDKGTNSSYPKYYNSGTAIRAYGGNTITISAGSLYITKITFVGTGGDGNALIADSGSINGAVWTGNADSVVFAIDGTSGNRRIQVITVEYLTVECNHFYSEWEITQDETCTKDGVKTRECLDCGIEDTDTILAHHNLEFVDRQEHYYEDGKHHDGHIAYYYCEDCDTYFADEDATGEIEEKDLVIAWEHTFETVPEVEATVDKDGKQSYKHCTVCDKNYELDGTTPITNLANWGIINYNCNHTNVWKLVNGLHVNVCSICSKNQIGEGHIPTNGTWVIKTVEGTETHVLPCGGDADCPFEMATAHNADYSNTYTVATDGDHVQACGGANCILVKDSTKHSASWGDYSLNDDETKHYQTCNYEGCGRTSDPVAHEVTAYTYSGNGQHSGTCVCGKEVTANCNSDGDYNDCTKCGRITSTIVNGGTVEFDFGEMYGIGNDKKIDPFTGVTIGNVKLTFAKGTGSTAPRYWTDGTMRLYSGNTFTIETLDNAYITKIEFTLTSNSLTDGTITWTKNNGTWADAESTRNKIDLTGTGQFTKLVVTYSSSFTCHHDNTVEQRSKDDATCENVGFTADCWYCTNCGKTFTSESCTARSTAQVLPATGHTYGDLIDAREGNCTDVAYLKDHYKCQNDGCNKYFDKDKQPVDESEVIGSTVADKHDWNNWTDNDDGTHSRTCLYDTEEKHAQTEPCTLDGDWVTDKDGHWHACPTCGYIDDLDEHKDENEDGICDICEYDSSSVEIVFKVVNAAGEDVTSEKLVTITDLTANVAIGSTVTFKINVSDDYTIVSVVEYLNEDDVVANGETYSYEIIEDVVVDGSVTIVITIKENAKGFKLATSATDLADGATIIFVSGTSAAGALPTSGKMRLAIVSVSVDNNTITEVPNSVLVLTLVKNSDNTYSFKNSDGDLLGISASGSNSTLQWGGNNTKWNITISDGSITSIVNTMSGTNVNLRLNAGVGFANYGTSTGSVPQIYVEQ